MTGHHPVMGLSVRCPFSMDLVPKEGHPPATKNCLFSQIWENLIFFKTPALRVMVGIGRQALGLAARVFVREGWAGRAGWTGRHKCTVAPVVF